MNEVIGFYRERDKYGCFSNFYRAPFKVAGQIYFASEQYIMEQKALLFEDYDIARKIMTAKDCIIVKNLGRKVSKYVDDIWEDKRHDLVIPGIYEKFRQNKIIKEILLSTSDCILAECAPNDRIWGIGMSINDARVQNPSYWNGRNLLGSYLMEVREMLKTRC